jgi:hypothetical protein
MRRLPSLLPVLPLLLLAAAASCGGAPGLDPRDFRSEAEVRDTLLRLTPPGTSLATAHSVMLRSGFRCYRDPLDRYDPATGLFTPRARYLECSRTQKVDPIFSHRWMVTHVIDSGRVKDIYVGYISEP